MEAVGSLEHNLWNPLYILGNENPFWMISKDTVIATWVVLLVLTMLLLLGRYYLRQKNSLVAHTIITAIRSFKDLTTQTMGCFVYQHFLLISSLFVFILLCNWISIIPFVEEPTKDLNTALAVGLISFFYKEWQTIRTHGLGGYLREFFEPLFFMFPVNVIGHFSKIISISFRLFGNIFGGSIITSLYTHGISTWFVFEFLGLLTGFNLLILVFFTIFEGLIQAIVFTMLTLTYLSIALQSTHGESNA